MFSLKPSFDVYEENFIDNKLDVESALSGIHEGLTTELIYDVMLASNEKVQHVGSFFAPTALLVMWQQNIAGFLREKLCGEGWTKSNGSGGVPYTTSPCKKHAIRAFSGDKYVGLKDATPSNNSLKGKTLEDDIQPLISSDNGTTIWVLIYYKVGDSIRMELSQPKSFIKGRIVGWNIRIKLPDIKFNVAREPLNQDKFEVDKVPVTRKKTASTS